MGGGRAAVVVVGQWAGRAEIFTISFYRLAALRSLASNGKPNPLLHVVGLGPYPLVLVVHDTNLYLLFLE